MSDPTALNVPIPGYAMTSDAQYGLKPAAPKSRSYRVSVSPINKSVFVGGDQIVWEIPTGRRGTFLDTSQSFLKFSVQFQAAGNVVPGFTGIYLENSAYCFFQRFDCYSGSNLLESINEYSQLANFLLDTSLNASDKAGLSSLIGTNDKSYSVSTVPAITQALVTAGIAATPITTSIFQYPGDRSGMSCAATTAINSSIPYTFALPLMSGVIGSGTKMLPVGKLNAPIRCEFFLSSNDDAIYYGSGAAPGVTFQIVNVEYECCFVEIQDDNFDIQLAPGQQEYISTTSYRNASSYIPAATSGEVTLLLPFRAASITALYARFRPYANSVQGVNATAAYRKCSINPNFSQIYFRIGSSIYPNKPIYLINGSLVSGGAEAYAELLKSHHALTSTIGNSALTSTMYNVAATATGLWQAAYIPTSKLTGTDTHANSFAIGLECSTFSNRSDTILSGVSTLNSQIYFTGVVNSGATCGGALNYNYTADFFCQMDMILVLQDGLLSAKY